MRLSILIPTYNHDCSQLVKDMAQQCKSLYGGAEMWFAMTHRMKKH